MSTEIEVLGRRMYLTYLARLQSHRRLAARGRAWNALLISFALAGVLASMTSLLQPDIYGVRGQTVVVFASVLALVGSLIVASMNYATRSQEMFNNYRKFQRLSVEAELLAKRDEPVTDEELKLFSDRHQSILDESENHTSGDWGEALRQSMLAADRRRLEDEARRARAIALAAGDELKSDHATGESKEKTSIKRRRSPSHSVDLALTYAPYLAIAFPIVLMWPIIEWLILA